MIRPLGQRKTASRNGAASTRRLLAITLASSPSVPCSVGCGWALGASAGASRASRTPKAVSSHTAGRGGGEATRVLAG